MFSLLRENKESCSSPVDGGRRDGVLQVMLEVRRGQRGVCLAECRQRERENICEDVPIVHAQVGVVKIASGYTFMTGKVLHRFRMKPCASY